MAGKFFDEFQVGDKFITPSRTITESDVVNFAGLSGDYNPLHTDAEFAKQTIFGERIAHGLVGISICTGLVARTGLFDGTIIAFLGINEWEFKKPIYFGDTIHAEMTILEKIESGQKNRGILIRYIELKNQMGEVIQKGKLPVMVKRK